jgi:RNA polymerase sporulation-specific sigma factor
MATLGFSSENCFHFMPDEEVVNLAHDGHPNAAEFLITRYRSLVENKARAYFVMGADHDDVVQEGMIGLYKAIRDFRTDRLTKFRPFAELCVTRQIITAVKTATRQKHVPLNGYVSLHRSTMGDASDHSLLDVLPDQGTDFHGSESAVPQLPQNLHEMAQHILSDLERSVLRFYLQGMSYREMGEQLEVHTKSIDNALQRVKRKIGHLLQD